jgi:hypothetical protein
MYPLRNVCSLRRRNTLSPTFAPRPTAVPEVQQTNSRSKSDCNFRNSATSAEGMTIVRRLLLYSLLVVSNWQQIGCEVLMFWRVSNWQQIGCDVLMFWRVSNWQQIGCDLLMFWTVSNWQQIGCDVLMFWTVSNWQQIGCDVLMFWTVSPYQICYHLIKFKPQGHVQST